MGLSTGAVLVTTLTSLDATRPLPSVTFTLKVKLPPGTGATKEALAEVALTRLTVVPKSCIHWMLNMLLPPGWADAVDATPMVEPVARTPGGAATAVTVGASELRRSIAALASSERTNS